MKLFKFILAILLLLPLNIFSEGTYELRIANEKETDEIREKILSSLGKKEVIRWYCIDFTKCGMYLYNKIRVYNSLARGSLIAKGISDENGLAKNGFHQFDFNFNKMFFHENTLINSLVLYDSFIAKWGRCPYKCNLYNNCGKKFIYNPDKSDFEVSDFTKEDLDDAVFIRPSDFKGDPY